MAYFMYKYRRRSEDQKTSSITHNGKIEFLWSAIPAVLLVVIFVWGEYDFVKQSVPPADALDVKITGRKWYWTVQYPQYPGVILTSNVDEPQVTILLPKDRPVRFTMTSEDVLHAFYIPAFRIKRDAVPGRYTQMWAKPTVVGEFNVFCAEYCGDFHSKMTGIAKVMPPELFEDAIEEAGKLEQEEGESAADFGKRIYSRRGCNACHSIEGKAGTGPAWNGLWTKTESFQDGSSLKIEGEAGMNYLRESILDPNAKLVSGFAGGMPSFQGQLDEKQVDAVIEFIKTL
jgi:cytochrome c oxidase subunit 2